MKKFLLTASMLVMGIVAMFAQDVPDASKWKVGEEIEGIIQNPSFTIPKDDGIIWEHKNASQPRVDESLFESYDSGTETQVYQYIQLPAGMYRLTCQGYYRGGGADQDAENYADYDNKWQDNTMLFAQKGEYDKASNTFKGATRIDKTPLMPRLFEHVQEQIYFKADDEADWADDHWYAAANGWGPGGSNGSRAWFAAGKYMPYEDDDVKYNIVDFIVPQTTYVKIGAMKVGSLPGGDTFFVTNFKLIYQGEAGEAAKLLQAQEECEDLYNQVAAIRDNENNKGLLSEKLGDELMLFDQTYGSDPYEMDMETAEKGVEALSVLLENAKNTLGDMEALKSAVASTEVLINTTNYSGLATLKESFDKAKASVSDSFDYTGQDWDTYKTLCTELFSARIEYLKTAPMVNGAYNFSALITTPFFCDTEYTPVWNEEANAYQFPTIEGVDKELQPENTWATVQEKGYADLKKEEDKTDWIPICENIVINRSEVENQWSIKVTTINGCAVTMQHSYPAIGGWVANPTGDAELLYQTITNLPDGYYSMSALMCNAGADITDLQYAYIESGENKATAPLTKKGSPWWGGNREAWRSGVWEKLTTDMIKVEGGKATIGVSSDAFYAATGFQLYYYGETPDFTAMLKSSFEETKAAANALPLAGDKKAANAILAKIPEPIPDGDAYDAASKTLAEANEYISKALACTGENWKAPGVFENLMKNLEADSPEFNFVYTAWEATGDLEDADNAVYTDATDYDNRSQAYVAYLDFRAAVGEFLKDDAVAAVVSEQNEYLKKNFATSEKLNEFKNAIGVPYNKAKFAALGANDATLDKPVDVSYILINPSFHQGPETGWTVEGTTPAINDDLGIEMVDGKATRTIAELYDRHKPFTFSQIVPGLPAGAYEIRTHALYRDNWTPDENGWKAYNEAGGEENWENHNAILFGKAGSEEWNAYVKSIYSLKSTKPTFTYYVKQGDWQYDEIDKESYASTITGYLTGTEDEIPDELKSLVDAANAVADGTVPFDKAVNTGELDDDFEDIIYYFPQRTIGLVEACKKDYNNYLSTVVVYLPEGGDLELGIKQEKYMNNESLSMYDFQLFYLGTEAPTAIDEVAEDAAAEGAVEYYSVNGVKLSAPQAGFNIVKYQDGTVKKIFIK